MPIAALAATLLPLAPARAGHWVFSWAGSSGSYATSATGGGGGSTTWTPPQPNSGTSTGFAGIGTTGYSSPLSQRVAVYASASATINAVITLTWTHGSGETDANDPAPTKIWLNESGSAFWRATYASNGNRSLGTGSCDDGLGDGPVDITDTGSKVGETRSSANAPTSPPPGAHLKSYPVSRGVLQLTRNFSAKADASTGPPATGPFGCTVAAHIGDYRLAIHAQPYGWYEVGWTDTNGVHHDGPLIDQSNYTMTFEYAWKSTSGNIADLAGITMYEYLD